jgi:hypothetical protein
VDEQCTLQGLDPDPNDDAAAEDQKVVDRNRVGFELHLQYVPTEEVITREVTGTLQRGVYSAWCESIKRGDWTMPLNLDDMVEQAMIYGPGPATGNILVDTPGRGPRVTLHANVNAAATTYDRDRPPAYDRGPAYDKGSRTCHNCGAEDHIIRYCPKPLKAEFRGKQNQAQIRGGGRGAGGQGRGGGGKRQQ